MQAPKYHESRLNFQLERFLFFSDGIFAISITLMVLEIRVPVLTENSDRVLWHVLSKMSLKLLGFLISFGIVGHYWSVHHRIFGYVKHYNNPLIWINLGFLFSVVLLPFSSGLVGEYSSQYTMYVPYAIYVLNICLTGFFNCFMWLYLTSSKRDFLTHQISPLRIKLGIYRSLILPVVFVFSLLVSFVFPILSRFIPLTIPFIIYYGMQGLEKKMLLNEMVLEAPPEEESI